ncbi:MAG: peptidoglycan DD-metalloendopeptidase family protein [Alphaproteobacteria bacterium]|nr:peptidoglycan DD-metalloendopeptidase family protein [Alphaproteobacteria bacterium]
MTVPGFKALIGIAAIFLVTDLSLPAFAAPENGKSSKSGKTGTRLEEVNRALGRSREKARRLKKEADQIEQDLARLRRDMVAAAKIIQTQESRASELIRALARLKQEEDAKLARLSANRGHMATVLVALQRVARYPPEALMMQPMSPADTVRSAILLRATVPEIKRRAFRLREDLEYLGKARRDMAEKRSQLSNVAGGLEAERKRLAVLFGQKTALKHQTLAKRRGEARRVKSLAGEAATLRDLLENLNKARVKKIARQAALPKTGKSAKELSGALTGLPPGLTGAPISSQRGKLPQPVVGRIVGRFGQGLRTGLKRKGMKLETAPGAQVVAPYEGRIVYAGNFRGYGELLIIEHGEGYHTLLSGLARIDSTMGQWVVSGEPVGVMGRSDRGNPVLYVVLRRNGQPINPLPWLSAKR